jgi:regulation of enolase protein 1 (concanavalin A-like superfamily)
MTWKDEVRKRLIQYQRDGGTSEFNLQEFYAFSEDKLSAEYPNNDHVRAKIRQVLQQLRDQGEIRFKDNNGNYVYTGEESSEKNEVNSVEILEQLESGFENI